ncbi:MAG: WD40 repeat domain-containing serine/threonine protein kinase [Planctomycetaceae bacterium]
MTNEQHGNLTAIVGITDEFLAELRGGGRPSIEEYVRRYPQHAEHIRNAFSALVAMERLARDELEFQPTIPEAFDAEFGDYRIIRELGRGGMGVVYQAQQVSLNRTVALKLLPLAATLDERQLKRFHIEAEAAAGLKHSHIVPVFAAGCHAGTHFYAMQFIDGCTLADIIRHWRDESCGRRTPTTTVESMGCAPTIIAPVSECSETPKYQQPVTENALAADASGEAFELRLNEVPMPIRSQERRPELPSRGRARHRWAAKLMIEIADALHDAHEHGIIHRDVKPSNVLLDRSGNAFVSDFGLARIETDATLTRPGEVLGTLAYISPEQLDGPPDRVDRRTDVYSLGATFYELLTLRRTFDENNPSNLRQAILHEEPVRMRRFDTSIDRDLEVITLHALSRDPDRRYDSCRDMADDLRAWLDGRPITARRPGLIHKASRWLLRHRGVVVGALALLILITIGALTAALLIDQQRRRAVQGEANALGFAAAEQKAHEQALAYGERAEAAEQLARDRLWSSLRSQARMLLRIGEPGQRFETLNTIRQALDARSGAVQLSHEDLIGLRDDAAAALGRFDIREEWRRVHAEESATIEINSFTPDFDHYSVHEGTLVAVRRIDNHSTAARLPLRSFPLVSRFSPDSKWLALSTEFAVDDSRPRLELWDWQREQRVFSSDSDGFAVPICRYSVAFDPLNERVAFGLEDGTVMILPMSDLSAGRAGRAAVRLEATSAIHALAWSPDGKYLLGTATDSSKALIWSVAKQTRVAVIPFSEPTYGVAWSPDGHRVAIGSGFATKLFVVVDQNNLTELETQPPHVLAGHSSPAHEIRFCPDSSLLATWGYDGTTRFWEAQRGLPLLVAKGHADGFDPQGRRLSFRGPGSFGVWELARDDVLWRATAVGTEQLSATHLAWLASGRILAVDSQQAVHFRDLNSHRWIARSPASEVTDLSRHPAMDDMLVCSAGQLLRLKLKLDDRKDGYVSAAVISEQVELPLNFRADSVESIPDESGGTIAVAGERTKEILLMNSDLTVRRTIPAKTNTGVLWLDPTGRFLITGERHGQSLEIFDIQSGQPVQSLSEHGTAAIVYQPRSGILITGSWRGYSGWDTQTWQKLYRMPRGSSMQPCAITLEPAGRWGFAAESGSSLIRFHPETGEVTGRLNSFDSQASIWTLSLDPDAHRLAVACGSNGLQIWDLTRLRREFEALEIDWYE